MTFRLVPLVVFLQVLAFEFGLVALANGRDRDTFSNVQELAMSGDCGAFVNFRTSQGDKIEVRIGISLVSTDNARQNLNKELDRPYGWAFAAVLQNQRKVWNKLFDQVEIETPNAREKTRFYSNFYRALSGRNIWSDVNCQWIDPLLAEAKIGKS